MIAQPVNPADRYAPADFALHFLTRNPQAIPCLPMLDWQVKAVIGITLSLPVKSCIGSDRYWGLK
jgi:hypothetical protein